MPAMAMALRASAVTNVRPNASIIGAVTEDYAKHKVWTRDGAASWRYYNTGVIVGADPRTDASTALTSFNFCTGRTGVGSFGLNQEAISHYGGYLTTAEVAAMNTAFSTYLAALGAI